MLRLLLYFLMRKSLRPSLPSRSVEGGGAITPA
jgi:hypothetical protein